VGESITRCGSTNNTFGRGFEGETGGVMANPDDTLGLESPADAWEDSATKRCTQSSCSRGTFWLEFRLVAMVPSKPNWEGGGAAAVKDHTASFFANKVPR